MHKRCATIFLAAFLVGQCHAQRYHVTDLGTLGGTFSQAFGINNSGEVVGRGDLGPTSHPFLWRAGVMTDLGELSASGFGIAHGISDASYVVGISSISTGQIRAFIWTATVGMQIIFPNDDVESQARAVNSLGKVVGYRNNRAFVWQEGTVVDLGALVGESSDALGVNDAGQVVGTGVQTAYIWDASTGVQWLGTIGGSASSATSINNNGQVVGSSATPFDQSSHGFLWSNGVMRDLGTLPGGSYSGAEDINDAGQVVGFGNNSQGENHACLWIGNRVVDLNHKIPPNSGWVLAFAQGINNAGQIVGIGVHNGNARGFLLTPV